MILDKLLPIVELAGQEPLDFNLEKYNKLKKGLNKELEEISKGLNKETQTRKNLDELITVLEKAEPNEYLLAKGLLEVAQALKDNRPAGKEETVNDYIQKTMRFYDRAQEADLLSKERERLKEGMSQGQQNDYDLRLFQNEGMMYCLEFDLMLYKTIKDAGEQGRAFIESEKIDLGTGELPGLWADLDADEVLSQFLAKILDDKVRNRLIKVYYELKKASRTDKIMNSFKKFLEALIEEYQKIGIEQLKSIAFKPYGEKPFLKDIVLYVLGTYILHPL